MNIASLPLFASDPPRPLGVGFHNVGSGVLRASHASTIHYVEHHYGERCGHLPLNARVTRVLVDEPTDAMRAHIHYLSMLFDKDLAPITPAELRAYPRRPDEPPPLVVPYVNVPEAETFARESLGAESWGLPAAMTHLLKNKADFYRLLDEFAQPPFASPDYIVTTLDDLVPDTTRFLSKIEDLYARAGLTSTYPLGVMLRGAESDGNYGSCLLYAHPDGVIVVQDGDASAAHYSTSWQAALLLAQKHLNAAIDGRKEPRVVASRYIDLLDSPGTSVVILENQVESLGWNGQFQLPGSRACVGTSSYTPSSAEAARQQAEYEAPTAVFFENFLRWLAPRVGIDFTTIRAVANLDLLLPGPLEVELQRRRGQPFTYYLAECNPRWTNYTDAILTILSANRQEHTLANMRSVIAAGICTLDKQPLPRGMDPRFLRACIAERDAALTPSGTRIICRMAQNPMGLIFAGDIPRARREMDTLLTVLSPG